MSGFALNSQFRVRTRFASEYGLRASLNVVGSAVRPEGSRPVGGLFSRIGRSFVVILMLGTPLDAVADSQLINGVPTSWRLQNYVGSTVNVWYAPSSCPSGALTFPASATSGEINRFWALIMAAKLGNHSVFVYYDSTSVPGTCQIQSFGMDG